MDIRIDGIKVHYEIKGAGKNVLLLHGWGASIQSFMPVVDALSEEKRVAVLDFPGFGESGKPPRHFGVSEYMELTAEFIRQTGIQKTDVICHSFGGRVTIMLAATYPELVDKIVFIDSAGLIRKRKPSYYLKVYHYKLMKKAARSKFGKRLYGILGIDVQNRLQNAGSADYKALDDDMKAIFVRVVNKDLKEYLKDIRSPSLLIWGENDTETPVRFGEIMEKEIPDAGLVVLKNAGHYAYLDRFPQFMKIIRHFLGGK